MAPVITHPMFAAVLGRVQGSTLRFDRAYARPSGLDAASAQRTDCDYVMTGTCDGAQDRLTWIDLASPQRYSLFGPPLIIFLARRSTRARAHRILPLGPIRFTSRLA
jgi:hypothetical protein